MADDHSESPQRWTAKRRATLILSILKGETSAQAVARKHGLTVAEVEECGCPEGGASKDRPFVPKTSDE